MQPSSARYAESGVVSDHDPANLAAAEGHPAAVMDVSFALQALSVEELVMRRGELAPAVHPVPASIDREVARLKLAALGVEIDEPTPDQAHYRESWT